MNRKSVALIRQWLDLNVYPHLDKETNAQSMWKKFADPYKRKNVQNKAFLIWKLVNMKYKEGDSMPEHLSSFQEIVNQLTTNEITLSDKLQALLLLSFLLNSWEVLIVTLTNSALNGKLTLSMVKESILNEESKRREPSSINTSTQLEALVVESRGRS